MHHIHQSLEALKVGAEICVHGIHFPCTLRAKEGDELLVDYDFWIGHEWPVETRSARVPYSAYEYTRFRSPDNLAHDPKGDWADVEQAYGIDFEGSQSSDPVKLLALRILKGDVDACMAVTRILQGSYSDDPQRVSKHGSGGSR
jgi:hypothetical protein